MNHNISNDDILLDRLVDGELPADERRALLQSLDSRPDGWRRWRSRFSRPNRGAANCGRLQLRLPQFLFPTSPSHQNRVRRVEQFGLLPSGLRWLPR